MNKMGGCTPAKVGKILVIVGGVNWGLVGLGMFLGSNLNIVHMIFGGSSTLEAIVYVLVGVCAVMGIKGCKCAKCMEGSCNCGSSTCAACSPKTGAN